MPTHTHAGVRGGGEKKGKAQLSTVTGGKGHREGGERVSEWVREEGERGQWTGSGSPEDNRKVQSLEHSRATPRRIQYHCGIPPPSKMMSKM